MALVPPLDPQVIMNVLAPLEPCDHSARLEQLLALTGAALVSVAGERKAYDAVQRVADAIPGINGPEQQRGSPACS
jgi:hypothetical protein